MNTNKTDDPDTSLMPGAPEEISCAVCGQNIPRSQALNVELNDYVFWFCGVECYTKWRNDAGKEKLS